MLNKIIEFSIKNKLIVGLFIVALVAYGSYQFTKLPIDAVPDITNNQVQVITSVPSLGATDIERLITFPIEQANSNIPGLKEIRSFSRFGLSVVTIVFDDAIDVYWARQQVTERLSAVKDQIPRGIGDPFLAPVTTGLGEIYQYAVRTKPGYEKKYDVTELRTIQDWIVRRQLLSVEGVAEVSSFGGKLKQFEIAIDPNKLQSYNITITDVFTALEKNNQNTGGAYIEKGPKVLYIRSEGLINTIENIKDISITNTNSGSPLFIRDVADVRIGSAIRYGAMTFNKKGVQSGEVSGAVVMMLKGANSNVVIKKIKERIEQIQKTLPEGVIVEPFLDRTKMVNNSISTVEKNLLEGALIVLFVLIFFLGNVRAGLIVASVIPMAMLIAVILMNLFGVSGNLMSLGALDFGLIVDGAVIIVEACLFSLHSRKTSQISQQEMDNTVLKTSIKMRNVSVFGELIILIVYIPIFTLRGIEGKMFLPMAQTIAFALFGAFILSLTYVPMMTALFLNKNISHKKTFSDRMMEKLENFYQPLLNKALEIPRAIIGTTLGLFVLALITLSFMGGEFMPSLEEGDFAVETRVLPGSNLQTSMTAISQGAKIILEKFPEVEKIVGKTGSSEVPTDPMPIDASDMMIILKDKSEWTSAKTFDELSEKMAKELEAVPGVSYGFQYPVQMRFNELMTGARQDVVCKIFGENLDTLALYANKLGKIVNTVEGTSDLYVETVTGMPQVVIDYNRASIAQYGLNIQDINRIVNTAFAGQSTGVVYEGEKRFDLVVRLTGEKRQDLADVQNLLIPTSTGSQIPLSQLAKVEITEGPNQIQREDAKRRIVVGFNVRGRDVQSIVKELQGKVETQIKFPAGYYPTYGGAFENLNEAKNRLMIAVPVSLLLIFILLYFAFNSVKQGLLIYSAIPLSAIGGIFFLALRGMPFSISAGVGFIALFGVAVLNGLVLIAEFNSIRKSGETDLKAIVLQGTKIRLRPVLMTAFVASLGFLPMALSNGSGAEVQKPLATVVIGGLLIATFLTLFVLPILYIMFEKGIKLKLKKIKSITTIMVLGLFFSFQNANAQEKISIEKAIETVLSNNIKIKNEKLNSEYLQKMTKTGYDIPNTGIIGEFGQFNSNVNDVKIGISQSIKFPTVYKRKKQLLIEEAKKGQWNEALQRKELTRQVTTVFYDMMYLKEKERLLLKSDSIYSEFLRKSTLRFDKGESNILEKTTAENQSGQIKIQLLELQSDYKIIQSQFKYLLNSDKDFIPVSDKFKMDFAENLDESAIGNQPSIKLFEQEVNSSKAEISLEKSKKLPELIGGVYYQTFKTNTTFQDSYNGVYGQFGVAIPLFNAAINNKKKALEINTQIAENNLNNEKLKLESKDQELVQEYKKHKETIAYYESQALKNVDLVTKAANDKFINGDINYLEWVMLINQSTEIQSYYIEAVRKLNISVIEINALTN
ncbi:CusA/CzcA family heavy metal efflux RND transporter [Flavobacterium gawalongense]|uniref:CusA/CzcA family heavy metal efflux RND transporter n=1 Tax=Flavobacterium gawalongense TaxID=2594432 RepID=A0ABY3CII1_9FLAO|nr:CusA/CzcA family heavy metal efflux RND transporter [Flavobacterium gawalongense]TRX00005.1 CusA/CzcA family heavy metal efflux RND transporter [Flavobacterium gawalongense]TRX04765.1 CusA/CzcA family heavy metal efflux RND transporter [Flavobacterium gawalongense]